MENVFAILEGRTLNFETEIEVKKPRRVLVTFLDEAENGAAPGEPLEEKFERLFARWYEETAIFSGSVVYENKNHQEMIALGRPAIPLMLKKLEEKPCYLFNALKKISGENPVPEAHHGNFHLIIGDWLNWGKNKGYIP